MRLLYGKKCFVQGVSDWFCYGVMSSQRDRDLELAARIGQSLLQRNHVLQERNESLEEQLAQAVDQVQQMHLIYNVTDFQERLMKSAKKKVISEAEQVTFFLTSYSLRFISFSTSWARRMNSCVWWQAPARRARPTPAAPRRSVIPPRRVQLSPLASWRRCRPNYRRWRRRISF